MRTRQDADERAYEYSVGVTAPPLESSRARRGVENLGSEPGSRCRR